VFRLPIAATKPHRAKRRLKRHMPQFPAMRLDLPHEAATIQLGEDLALAARRGDIFCLRGELGAGKSTLARAMIRNMAGNDDLEVPSPTYTICQAYDFATPVRHFDLYRLGDPSDIVETGLEDDLDTTITLIEWPQLAEPLLPVNRITIDLDFLPAGRRATITAADERGEAGDRIARSLAIRAFVEKNWTGGRRSFLQGDASTRRYEKIARRGKTRILMDARRQPDGPAVYEGKPYSRVAKLAEDVIPFVAIDQLLHEAGFASPQIYAADTGSGLLLIEDLGEGRITDSQNRPVIEKYCTAARLLAHIHAREWPRQIACSEPARSARMHRIPDYDRAAMMIEISLFADWYAPRHLGRALNAEEKTEFNALWNQTLDTIGDARRNLVLRDFHSPNLIWREDRRFPASVGLIDFQDAVIGPIAYDLASLAQDARVDMTPEAEEEVRLAYANAGDKSGLDEKVLDWDYHVMAAQRATKILGIFVRLDERDGKPAYLAHLPRMQDYLRRSLARPALAALRDWYTRVAGL
jgi:N-acetylmuramate 1-kinase